MDSCSFVKFHPCFYLFSWLWGRCRGEFACYCVLGTTWMESDWLSYFWVLEAFCGGYGMAVTGSDNPDLLSVSLEMNWHDTKRNGFWPTFLCWNLPWLPSWFLILKPPPASWTTCPLTSNNLLSLLTSHWNLEQFPHHQNHMMDHVPLKSLVWILMISISCWSSCYGHLQPIIAILLATY